MTRQTAVKMNAVTVVQLLEEHWRKSIFVIHLLEEDATESVANWVEISMR